MLSVKKLFADKSPAEDPDWGYARTCRALLRSPNAEFSQSVFSGSLNGSVIPNRDYPFEGFSAYLDGENWKFLDGMAFCLRNDGQPLPLSASNVRIFPWKAVYKYDLAGRDASLEAEYYLLRGSRAPALSVLFKLRNFHSRNLLLSIMPLVDIRHMYAPSDPASHETHMQGNGLSISREGRQLFILSKNFLSAELQSGFQHWHYKLGSGNRTLADGVRFIPEERQLYIPGTIALSFTNNSSEVQLFASTKRTKPSLELRNHDENRTIHRLSRYQKPFLATFRKIDAPAEYKLALQARLLALLDSFDLQAARGSGLAAGAYWFRNIWFRDEFQALYDNFDIFFKTRKADVKGMLLSAMRLQQKGLMPNKLPEVNKDGEDYASVDSTLLCFLCSLEYAKRQRDPTLLKNLKESVKSFISSLSEGGVKLENYLLRTPPQYSWIDSFTEEKILGSQMRIPSRVPKPLLQYYSSASSSTDELRPKISGPNFYLVELNALWARFLRDFNSLFPSPEFESLAEAAGINLKSFFFNGKYPHLLDENLQAPEELCSTSLYSASLVPELFSEEEISQLLKKFEPLLVYRNRKLFGILVRDSAERIFFGDSQYHGATLWPRDSIALCKLLARAGDMRYKELLASNLEHQMEEGAIFYSHELFSLPEGPNPHPSGNSYSPVPVKNPAQLWSQFVQPYFDYL